jgi:uncharacterized protein YukE
MGRHTRTAPEDAMLDPGSHDWSFYPAHMRPIDFPTAEAAAAEETCDRIAGMLEDHLGARAGLVASAQDGWEGTYREEFDDTWATQSVRISGLKEDLRRLASQIATAAENVQAANSRRASLRVQYIEDLQDEAS